MLSRLYVGTSLRKNSEVTDQTEILSERENLIALTHASHPAEVSQLYISTVCASLLLSYKIGQKKAMEDSTIFSLLAPCLDIQALVCLSHTSSELNSLSKYTASKSSFWYDRTEQLTESDLSSFQLEQGMTWRRVYYILDGTTEERAYTRAVLQSLVCTRILLKISLRPPRLHNYLYASEYCHIEVVQVLLSHPVSNNFSAYSRCLHRAAKGGRVKTVKLLLCDERTDPTLFNRVCLMDACENGHAAVVSVLLGDPRVDPSCQNGALFLLACANGHIEVVKLLLPRVPEQSVSRGLLAATASGRASVVSLLLKDKRLHLNSLCLVNSCKYLQTKVLRLLLKDGRADPRAQSGLCLFEAAKRGYHRSVRLLLEDERARGQRRSSLTAAIENGLEDREMYRTSLDLFSNRGGTDLRLKARLDLLLCRQKNFSKVVSLLTSDPGTNV